MAKNGLSFSVSIKVSHKAKSPFFSRNLLIRHEAHHLESSCQLYLGKSEAMAALEADSAVIGALPPFHESPKFFLGLLQIA